MGAGGAIAGESGGGVAPPALRRERLGLRTRIQREQRPYGV